MEEKLSIVQRQNTSDLQKLQETLQKKESELRATLALRNANNPTTTTTTTSTTTTGDAAADGVGVRSPGSETELLMLRTRVSTLNLEKEALTSQKDQAARALRQVREAFEQKLSAVQRQATAHEEEKLELQRRLSEATTGSSQQVAALQTRLSLLQDAQRMIPAGAKDSDKPNFDAPDDDVVVVTPPSPSPPLPSASPGSAAPSRSATSPAILAENQRLQEQVNQLKSQLDVEVKRRSTSDLQLTASMEASLVTSDETLKEKERELTVLRAQKQQAAVALSKLREAFEQKMQDYEKRLSMSSQQGATMSAALHSSEEQESMVAKLQAQIETLQGEIRVQTAMRRKAEKNLDSLRGNQDDLKYVQASLI